MDGREQIKIPPTQFLLTEDGVAVTGYAVGERAAPGALAVAFLFPRTSEPARSPFNQGVLSALLWKRPADLWSAVPFVTAAAQKDTPLLFSGEAGQVSESFLNVPAETDCCDFWGAIRRSVQVDSRTAKGQRHLVVYGPQESGQPAGNQELLSAALSSHTAVHAISLTANAALESLCQETKGNFRIAASEAEVSGEVEQACLGLLARYAIRYQPTGARATSVGIRVQSAAGWGETSVSIAPRG